MLVVWYIEQLINLTIKYMLSDDSMHSSGSNNKIVTIDEAQCIILKYFAKHLHLEKNIPTT